MARERKIELTLISAAIFIIMEIAAFGMLRRTGELQNIWISHASHWTRAKLWGSSERVSLYFGLNKENQRLAEENLQLSAELHGYREKEAALACEMFADSLRRVGGNDFSFIPAGIVKISRNKQHNYFILNKGSEDGVRPQSGVITEKGVVGVIDAVDKHYSYGLTLMNTGVSISARIGSEGAIGALGWNGISNDQAILREIPLQYKFEPGDTVWTSGFSSLFPADIPLGVTGGSRIVNGAVNEVNVTLFQSASVLRFATIAVNNGRDEILYLEGLEEEGIQ